MDGASFQFVVFGLTVALISNISRAFWWRALVLLIGSAAFLLLLGGRLEEFSPLAGFLLLGYGACWAIHRTWPRAGIWGVSCVLLTYIWLKKYTFLPSGIFLHSPYFTLGLSYIFFRVLHLIIESGEGGEKPQVTPLAYLLYTINFTTLISGPIQRYSDFLRDQYAAEPQPLDLPVVGNQLERIIRGFFKVNVLAMLLNAARENALDQVLQTYLPMQVKYFAAFSLAIIYPLFLYCNFSGYIDIVIAVARLMRLRLPENFDRPFSACSFIDFWNRWHITLSTWLKTYVYNPLMIFLMRRIEAPSLQPLLGVLCLFVTFFLIGIWHGRTSEFFAFGMIQGGGVALNALWRLALGKRLGRQRYKALSSHSIYRIFSRGLTFSWFAFSLFWFWASWKQLGDIFHSIGGIGWLEVWIVVWCSASLLLALWEALRGWLLSMRTRDGAIVLSRYARVAYASAMAFLAFVIMVILRQPAPDIVYKAF